MCDGKPPKKDTVMLDIEANLWLPRTLRLKRAYPPRNRRECYGELIQIDGSLHHWFEDRGDRCTLLVYIREYLCVEIYSFS